MGDTKIEWSDKVWNPTRGCSRVSEGCRHCYAETLAGRYSAFGANPDSPFAGFVTKVNGHASWTGKVELVESMLMLPLSWRKPRRVFVNSMSDLFHEALPDEAIDRMFAVMALCPQHTFQILTKRPERMLKYLSDKDQTFRIGVVACDMRGGLEAHSEPLPNVWLGVSVEDQATADERIPLLLQTPAAIRFVSMEPLLSAVDMSKWLIGKQPNDRFRASILGASGYRRILNRQGAPSLDWIIIGGESGPGARPFNLKWARDTVAQCGAANVACFVKQLGANPFFRPEYPNREHKGERVSVDLADRKGGRMEEWEQDLRVRQFPFIQSPDKVSV